MRSGRQEVAEEISWYQSPSYQWHVGSLLHAQFSGLVQLLIFFLCLPARRRVKDGQFLCNNKLEPYGADKNSYIYPRRNCWCLFWWFNFAISRRRKWVAVAVYIPMFRKIRCIFPARHVPMFVARRRGKPWTSSQLLPRGIPQREACSSPAAWSRRGKPRLGRPEKDHKPVYYDTFSNLCTVMYIYIYLYTINIYIWHMYMYRAQQPMESNMTARINCSSWHKVVAINPCQIEKV